MCEPSMISSKSFEANGQKESNADNAESLSCGGVRQEAEERAMVRHNLIGDICVGFE